MVAADDSGPEDAGGAGAAAPVPGLLAGGVVGFGDPVLDIVARVPHELLVRLGTEPGGCVPVDAGEMVRLLALPEVAAATVLRVPGGSAANVCKGLAGLAGAASAGGGAGVSFLGMVGADAAGREYRDKLAAAGVDPSLLLASSVGAPTGTCLCLVTPDGQRTMRTHLGASGELADPRALPLGALAGRAPALLHAEGYCLYRAGVAAAVMRAARAAGAAVSLDLASFEVVRGCFGQLQALLAEGLVDVLFCNADEAGALCATAGVSPGAEGGEAKAHPNGANWQQADRQQGQGSAGEEEAIGKVAAEARRQRRAAEAAQRWLLRHPGVRVAVVSQGKRGCIARSAAGESAAAPADCTVAVVDTVGAGDLFTAGWLFAWLAGADLAACCAAGCAAGAAAVQMAGAELGERQLTQLRERIGALLWHAAAAGEATT